MIFFTGVCFFALLVAWGSGLFNKPIEMAGEFNHYLHEKYGTERGRLLSVGSFGGLFLLWCAAFYYALHKMGRKEYHQLIEADLHHTENHFKNSIELVFKVGVVIAELIEASSPLSKEKVDGFIPSSPVVSQQQNAPKKQKLNVTFDFVVDNSGKQKNGEEKLNDFDTSFATRPSFWQPRRSIASDEQKVPEFQHINFGCWGTWDAEEQKRFTKEDHHAVRFLGYNKNKVRVFAVVDINEVLSDALKTTIHNAHLALHRNQSGFLFHSFTTKNNHQFFGKIWTKEDMRVITDTGWNIELDNGEVIQFYVFDKQCGHEDYHTFDNVKLELEKISHKDFLDLHGKHLSVNINH